MSQVQLKIKRPQILPNDRNNSRQTAEKLLREAAFVLQMTQRVKNAIRCEKISSQSDWC